MDTDMSDERLFNMYVEYLATGDRQVVVFKATQRQITDMWLENCDQVTRVIIIEVPNLNN